jgi:N-acetylneuraminic acid mutarotase
MAWATECTGYLHLVGGYAEQRVDHPYHHVYDPASGRWTVAAPLPRGANRVGVACMDGWLYAVGGFIEQKRRPHKTNSNLHYIYDPAQDKWEPCITTARFS